MYVQVFEKKSIVIRNVSSSRKRERFGALRLGSRPSDFVAFDASAAVAVVFAAAAAVDAAAAVSAASSDRKSYASP